LSTLADLFNIRIGVSRKALFVERARKGFRFVLTSERLPLREGMRAGYVEDDSLDELLSRDEFAGALNLYYVLSPHDYYRNTMTFPFSDRAKIDAVIGYEISDYMPRGEADCLTDFTHTDGKVTAFSIEREKVRRILSDLGIHREKLKGLIPYDAAVFQGTESLIDEDSRLVVIMNEEGIYLQSAEGGMMGHALFFERDGEEERVGNIGTFHAMIRMAAKRPGIETVYIGRAPAVKGDFPEDLFEGMNLTSRPLSLGKLEARIVDDLPDVSYLPLYGALLSVTRSSPGRINLLKGEFKPQPKGFVSLKEFAIAGVLLIILAIVSTVGLTIDLRLLRNRAARLEESLKNLSREVFGKEILETAEAQRSIRAQRQAIETLEESTDTRRSSLRLLRELALYFPGDVPVEYSDVIVEKDRIRLSGKARAFSDIDRIEKDLLMSDLFQDVTVVNTATTGSTEGFTVTFVIDIAVDGE
jgi:hypothetical protein